MTDLNILEIKKISKSFVGIDALKQVDLTMRQGETLALLGENGAGKSTLIKIILGVERANSGEVWFNGELKNYLSPNDAYKEGISAMFQETSLVPQLTVLQNVFLGDEVLKSFGRLDEEAMLQKFEKTCKGMGLQLDPHRLVESLSAANQKLLEIVKALTKQSRFIVMDEPTDSLSPAETERLLNIIQNLKSQNVSVLYISHKLEEVFKVADRITVLRDGQNVFTSDNSNCTVAEVITSMVGEPVENHMVDKNELTSNFPLLKLSKLSVGETLNEISLDVHLGEVVGITGLIGSGKTKLAKTLFGLSSYDKGEIKFNGKDFKPECPKDAIKEGIHLAPEDRKTQGLNLDFEIYKNITITNLSDFLGVFGLIQNKEISTSEKLLSNLNFRGGTSTKRVRKLSGGNQQKVVVSKWLHNQPKLLILDEPTKGMDVKARQEIINIVRKLAKKGCAVLYLTSDFNEAKQASERILLLHSGQLVGEVEPTESVENMMQLIFNLEKKNHFTTTPTG
jgi:ribose transport system ATP-binding protein